MELTTQAQLSSWGLVDHFERSIAFATNSTKTMIEVKILIGGEMYVKLLVNYDETGETCTNIEIGGGVLTDSDTLHGSKVLYTFATNTVYYLDLFHNEPNELSVSTYNEVKQEGIAFNNIPVAVTL